MIIDEHEYMIWRAVTKYDLLHDESSGATEENVEEMIDEKERQITRLIPSYFVGKEKYHDEDIGRMLKHTVMFVVYREDRVKWGNHQLLCCTRFIECNKDAPIPKHLLSARTGWPRYRLRSYDEVIAVLRNSIEYSNYDYSDINKVKLIFIEAGIYTEQQLENASVFFMTPWQILPDGLSINICLAVGQDYNDPDEWKIGDNKNE